MSDGNALTVGAPEDGASSSTGTSSARTGGARTARPRSVHFRSDRNDWETPDALWTQLRTEFRFDLDVAATPENRLAGERPRGWDALDPDSVWGQTNYINPPYGRTLGDWLEAAYCAASTGRTVVLLLPARTDTHWWHRFVMKADEVRLIHGRLRFSKHRTGAPFPSCVVVFRPYPQFRAIGAKFSTYHWR